MANYSEIRMDRQDRYITTTEREIRQYRENELCTSDVISEKILDVKDDIEQLRYIRLTKKINIDEKSTVYHESSLTMNNMHIDSSSILGHNKCKDFKSKQVLYRSMIYFLIYVSKCWINLI